MSSNSSLLQAVRCMSSSKVFVGGLSFATDDTTLKDAFSHYGDVLEVIIDRDSARSKGFGFITYTSSEEAAASITAMDGKDLQGRVVRVAYTPMTVLVEYMEVVDSALVVTEVAGMAVVWVW